jgi:hypothetical protein
MEEWRDIPGFEGFYQASSEGRIRSVGRDVRSKGGGVRFSPSRILQQHMARYAILPLSVLGKRTTGLVHRLVCLAFNGPPPFPGAQAAHIDGDRTNNIPSNLYWASAEQNCADRARHGTWVHGERVNTNKLSEADIAEIITRVRAGEMRKSVAAAYGVHRSSIDQLMRGDTWKHLS